MLPAARLLLFLSLHLPLGLVACGGGESGGAKPDAQSSLPPEPGTPQRPPRAGMVEMEAWLAEKHHRSWRCEPGISAMRLNGSHGRHRICSNDLLLASGSTNASEPYPVGAASVKELHGPGDELRGHAVGLKVLEGPGAQTWYWYEAVQEPQGTRVVAQGVGVPDCAVCHGSPAARDYVFFRAAAP